MQKYQNNVTGRNGDVVTGGSVLITAAGSVTPSTIYSDNGSTVVANPLTTDANGYFEFFAADGTYDIRVNGTLAYTDVLIVDALTGLNGRPTNSELAASDGATKVGTTAGTVQAALDARPTSAALAATDGAAEIGTTDGTVQEALDERPTESSLNTVGGVDIAFSQAGAGADVMTTLEKLRQRYTLADYYEPSEGSAAMANAVARVVAQASRQTVEIDVGDFDWTLNGDIALPAAKRVLVHGHGAINFAGGSFVRNAHNQYTALHGFKATGAYPLFKYSGAPSGSASRDFEITSVEASMNSGVWAVYLDGAREGIIDKCVFNAGRGIYRTLSNICYISNSFFLGLGFAIHDDGAGSAFSCGINISNCEVLGCNRSIVVSQCDDGEIVGCTIDYNDEGIYLLSQDRFKIFGGYIGTRTAEAATPNVAIGGVTPAINVIGTSGIPSEKIKIIGAVLTGHHPTDAEYDNIYAEYALKLVVADSDMTFFTRNGIRYGAGVTDLTIHDNNFANRSGTATYSIECTGADDSSNRIHHNNLPTGKGIVAPLANIRSNTRFLTQQQGEAIAGSGVSSVNVTLALAYTPAKSDVALTPTNAAAAAAGPYVSAVTATQLTIGFNTATAASSGVRWRVEKNQIAG
jgi:hypothetical protein